MTVYIAAFLISLILSYLLTPLAKKLALLLGAIDRPNSRRVNSHPVPTIGGLAIFISFIATVLLFSISRIVTGIIIGGTFIFVLGFFDDLYEISPRLKLIGQIIGALILVFFGVEIKFITNPLGGMFYLGYWGGPLTVLWIVSITNTVNLIDGLDGLAAGVSTIAVLTLFFVGLQEGRTVAAILAIVLAGSSLGFLRYNFHPAQIFMGDSGSMFTGFILAAISVTGALKSAAAVTVVVPFLALGIPIFDTVFAIVRRIYNNKPIGEADRGHLHHRLLALGWNQLEAVLIVYGISIILGIMALIINGSNFHDALILLGMVTAGFGFGAWKIGIFTVDLPSEGQTLEKSNV